MIVEVVFGVIHGLEIHENVWVLKIYLWYWLPEYVVIV